MGTEEKRLLAATRPGFRCAAAAAAAILFAGCGPDPDPGDGFRLPEPPAGGAADGGTGESLTAWGAAAAGEQQPRIPAPSAGGPAPGATVPRAPDDTEGSDAAGLDAPAADAGEEEEDQGGRSGEGQAHPPEEQDGQPAPGPEGDLGGLEEPEPPAAAAEPRTGPPEPTAASGAQGRASPDALTLTVDPSAPGSECPQSGGLLPVEDAEAVAAAAQETLDGVWGRKGEDRLAGIWWGRPPPGAEHDWGAYRRLAAAVDDLPTEPPRLQVVRVLRRSLPGRGGEHEPGVEWGELPFDLAPFPDGGDSCRPQQRPAAGDLDGLLVVTVLVAGAGDWPKARVLQPPSWTGGERTRDDTWSVVSPSEQRMVWSEGRWKLHWEWWCVHAAYAQDDPASLQEAVSGTLRISCTSG